ncbi:MAG: DnaA/Hda family protein [Planctomycetes bacterium]|jgi:chromosomal replication initiator protein|nr:DnaA/Hda family protein [Planctomycetota bacterium]
MLPVLEESWTRVQDALRQRAGAAAYEAWLAELRPVLLERGTAYLEAKNRLAADRVRAMFRPLLEDVLSADIGTKLVVELQANEPARFDALEVSPQQPVVDDGNRTAWLVLKSLGGGRPLPSNLFLFHGQSGVGKTFLLKWWRERLVVHPRTDRALWFDLPALLKAFQSAHHDGRVDQLREELCQDRALVIDELHRIAGKPKLQAFVLAVLKARQEFTQPTVLASRWHPSEVRDLDPALASSLLAGFVASIERPGPLGRLRYLRALEGTPSRNGRAGHVESLAQQVQGTFPELRAAWAKARGGSLPPKYLELIDPRSVFTRLRDRVADKCAVPVQELPGKRQGRTISRARKVLAYLCLQNGLSGSEVGRFLGGRTRAAVSYMALSLQQELTESADLRQLIEELT